MEESRQRIAKASRDPRANGDRDGGQVGFRNRKTPCGGTSKDKFLFAFMWLLVISKVIS